MRESPASATASLSTQLQNALETLVSAEQPDQIYRTVLTSVLEAMKGTAGVVLVVREAEGDLEQVASRGFPEAGQLSTLAAWWEDSGPVMAAFHQRQPLCFETEKASLLPPSPSGHRIETAGSAAAIVIPMFLENQPLGAILLEVQEQVTLPAEEQRFLKIMAAQCAAAIGRVRRFHALEALVQERTVALDGFTAFTEAVGLETDELVLAQQAMQVIRANLMQVSTAYYEQEDGLWKARLWSEDMPGEVVANIRTGVPLNAPNYAEGARSADGIFIDGWNAEANSLEISKMYGAVAFFPIRRGETVRLLAIGTYHARAWLERERSLMRAVSRSLNLAMERAASAQQLKIQNAELEAHSKALEAFAQLTNDLNIQSDPYTLVKRAQEVVLSLIPDGYTRYYEQNGPRWLNRVQTGDSRNPELQAFVDAGPPVGTTPTVDRAWLTQRPYYQDLYDQGGDTPPDMARHLRAAASLPVVRQGQTVGVFVAVLFEQRTWSTVDKNVLETVVSSLGLALERSVQTQALEGERTGLDAFAAFTEAVGSEPDVRTLARKAAQTLRATLDFVSVAYYEVEGEVWKARAWSEDIAPEVITELQKDVPREARSFSMVVQSKTPHFFNHLLLSSEYQETTSRYGRVALLPIFSEGEVRSMMLVGLPETRQWTERKQAIVRAVARGLGLAVERAEAIQQLKIQRDLLDAKTEALSAANEELEAFTHSASHDLRTPIRHVMAFADLARRALDKGQLEKVLHHLEVVQQGALRMSTLVDGMLALSRAGQNSVRHEEVLLEALVAQAQRDVALEFPGQPIDWHLGRLPQIRGDAGLLQQVVTNLISNAVKYSGTREVSKVEIWASEETDEWVIYVRDNGVGFDPQHAQKLFGLFQRLHSQNEFVGIGVGLATVRRIILKHGGRVFAESAPTHGATFGFTLLRPLQSEG